jgi:3-methylcrotonyl-CoA carboxylase beta subunit
MFSWPQSQISVMGAEQAANTLADVKIRQLAKQGKEMTPEAIAAIRDPVLGEFKRKQSAYWATSEIWDDGMLDPVDTRNALGMAISAALNTPIGDPRYGVFRL